jgi:hypothetical protein
MGLDRAQAEGEFVSDVLVTQATGGQPQHLSFALAECLGRLRLTRSTGSTGKPIQHLTGDRGMEHRLSGVYGSYCVNKLAAPYTLQQVASGPSFQEAENKLVIVVGSKYQHGYVVIQGLDPPRGFDTVHLWHGNINYGNVWFCSASLLYRFLTIPSLGDYLQVWLLFKDLAGAFTHYSMVVSDQNSDFVQNLSSHRHHYDTLFLPVSQAVP